MIRMEGLFLFILSVAMSMDAFAEMTVEGSMLSRINYGHIFIIGSLFGIWQDIVMWCGQRITQYLLNTRLAGVHLAPQLMHLIAELLFICLALYMFYKGQKEKHIHETRLDELNFKGVIWDILKTSLDAFVVGIALTFISVPVRKMFIPLFLISLLSAYLGIWNGRHNGIEYHSISYDIGGILFIIIGVGILF